MFVLRFTFSTLRSFYDDGIENAIDPNPLFCDGDFFGPANILPEGATSFYCVGELPFISSFTI